MSRTDSTIPTVLAGAVRHARDYAAAIAAHDDLGLVGIVEDPTTAQRSLEDADTLASAYAVPRFAPDEVDPGLAKLAVVCTEPTRHAAVARMMAGRGLHLVVDKPVATEVADARALHALVTEEGLQATVITRARSGPVQRLRGIIDRGELGLPRSVEVEFLASSQHLASSVERLELVVDPAWSGGGELLNFLGYAVDVVRELTGCEPLEVYAEAATLFSSEHRRFDAEDTGVVSFRFTNELVGGITIGRVPAAPTTAPVSSTLRVIGSHDHISLDTDAGGIKRFSGNGQVTEVSLPGQGPDPVTAVLDDAVRMVRESLPPPYSLEDAIVSLAAVKAAIESADTGDVVAVVR